MAGKRNKNSSDNFEKIKREMTVKRQQAMKKESNNISSTGEINDIVMTASEINVDIKIQVENIEILEVDLIKSDGSDKILEEVNERNSLEIYPNIEKMSNEDLITEEKEIEMVVFWIGEEEFAFKISNVKEIIRIPSLTKAPNLPFYVAGLCVLRGQLLPVLDGRKLFGLIDKEQNENCRIIIVETNGKSVGLITDKVSQVVSIDKSTIKEPPSSIKEIDGGVINGMLLLNKGKRVIMLLDATKIIKTGQIKDESGKQGNLGRSDNDKEIMEEDQIIVFNVGKEEYSFNINNVKEIIRFPNITKVPNHTIYIEGVFSLRNQLIALINLGKLLGTDYKEPDEYSRVIIINTGKLTFGVIVDKASQVMRVSKDSFKMGNQGVSSNRIEYIKGFFNLNNGSRLVMLLESQKLISASDVNDLTNLDNKNSVEDTNLNTSEIVKSLEKIVIFKLDKVEYGVRIDNVKEINRMCEMSYFPGCPVFIEGMVSLRGDIIPVLNLRILFGLQTVEKNEFSKFIVVEYEKKSIGIIIDSASEVLGFSKTSVEEISKSLKVNGEISYLDGVVKLNQGKRIVLLLNLKSVLSFY